MPKPRTLDTDFWDDEDVASLTHQERLLLIGMIALCADDRGRLQANARYLCKHVFGYDDDITVEQVEQMRNAIVAKCRNVHAYTVHRRDYIWLANFEDRQNIRYVVESKLPPPPDSLTSSVIAADSGNLPQSPENHCRVGLGSVEQGREEKGRVAVAEGCVENAAAAADFGKVFQIIENTWRPQQLSPEQCEEIKDIWNEFDMLGLTQWKAACRELAINNVRNLNYLRECLGTQRDGGTGPPGQHWSEQYATVIKR